MYLFYHLPLVAEDNPFGKLIVTKYVKSQNQPFFLGGGPYFDFAILQLKIWSSNNWYLFFLIYHPTLTRLIA